MLICEKNPKLLNDEHWFLPELLKEKRKRNSDRETALMKLFHSHLANTIDFSSPAFHEIFNAEKDMLDGEGKSTLMYMCKYNPQLLESQLPFVEVLLK